MLFESQRYIHMCTKGKLLIDNPERIKHYFPHSSENTILSRWPEVCLGQEGTGHLIDLIPGKQFKEFETGMSIFKAFSGKIEHYSHEHTKFEPSHLKKFAFTLDSMNAYQQSELQNHHKTYRYKHSIDRLNHYFKNTKYTFGL